MNRKLSSELDLILNKNNLFYIALILIFVLVPLFVRNPYVLHVLIKLLLFAYLGGSWNILGGYTGQFSLGHAAFFGIGSYVSTLLYIHYGLSPWIGMLGGGLQLPLLGYLLVFYHFGMAFEASILFC